MFQNAAPLFPQGVVALYKFQGPKFDINLLDDIEIGNPLNGVVTSQISTNRNETVLDKTYFSNIKQFALDSVGHYLKNIEGIDYEEFWISASWVNFCQPGGFQEFHNHANSIVSGCFYIDADETHPGLTFKREKRNYSPYFVLYNPSPSGHNADRVTVPVVSNDLLIFPSYMVHGHEINNSNTTRIGIAFNVLVNQKDEIKPGWYHIKFQK
jgi:uncharacterized protein (TIGR02466 family)